MKKLALVVLIILVLISARQACGRSRAVPWNLSRWRFA